MNTALGIDLGTSELKLALVATAVSDMSDAAGTLWLDVGGRAWSAPLLQAGGMTQTPALVEGSAVSGHLQPEAAAAPGLFFGMHDDTDAARLGHAVIEAVGFGLADGLRALRDAGTAVSRLTLVGGGARSAHWAQLPADTPDIELPTFAGAEAGGAMGAARLAWLAFGLDEDEVCKPPAPRALFQPRAERRAALQAHLERFRERYRRTRDLLPRDGSPCLQETTT